MQMIYAQMPSVACTSDGTYANVGTTDPIISGSYDRSVASSYTFRASCGGYTDTYTTHQNTIRARAASTTTGTPILPAPQRHRARHRHRPGHHRRPPGPLSRATTIATPAAKVAAARPLARAGRLRMTRTANTARRIPIPPCMAQCSAMSTHSVRVAQLGETTSVTTERNAR